MTLVVAHGPIQRGLTDKEVESVNPVVQHRLPLHPGSHGGFRVVWAAGGGESRSPRPPNICGCRLALLMIGATVSHIRVRDYATSAAPLLVGAVAAALAVPMEFLNDCALSAEVKERFAHGTAERLLDLDGLGDNHAQDPSRHNRIYAYRTRIKSKLGRALIAALVK